MPEVTDHHDIKLDVEDIDDLLENGYIGDIKVKPDTYVAIACQQGTLSDLMKEHYDQGLED